MGPSLWDFVREARRVWNGQRFEQPPGHGAFQSHVRSRRTVPLAPRPLAGGTRARPLATAAQADAHLSSAEAHDPACVALHSCAGELAHVRGDVKQRVRPKSSFGELAVSGPALLQAPRASQ